MGAYPIILSASLWFIAVYLYLVLMGYCLACFAITGCVACLFLMPCWLHILSNDSGRSRRVRNVSTGSIHFTWQDTNLSIFALFNCFRAQLLEFSTKYSLDLLPYGPRLHAIVLTVNVFITLPVTNFIIFAMLSTVCFIKISCSPCDVVQLRVVPSNGTCYSV